MQCYKPKVLENQSDKLAITNPANTCNLCQTKPFREDAGNLHETYYYSPLDLLNFRTENIVKNTLHLFKIYQYGIVMPL